MAVRHEQCPKCAEFGRDRHADNLAVYEDGGKYCFSCGHTDLSEKKAVLRLEDNPTIMHVKPDLERDLDKWPAENLAWLRQFLSDTEIRAYFGYDRLAQRHVFLVPSAGSGWFWEARSVIREPKSLQHGVKPYFPIWNNQDDTQTIVIVEDIVSALVVNRSYSVLPLFGSVCRNQWIAKLMTDKFYKRVIVWLDNDKLVEAMDISRRISMGKPCHVLHTEMDPKWYSTEEVQDFVENTHLKQIVLANEAML